jgi:hypothetical protein
MEEHRRRHGGRGERDGGNQAALSTIGKLMCTGTGRKPTFRGVERSDCSLGVGVVKGRH